MKKLSNREQRLLKLLGAALAGLALVLLLAAQVPEWRSLQDEIARREMIIGNIQALRVNEAELGRNYDRLTGAIATEKDRYYASQEQDLTRLGIRMLALVRKNGLRYTRLNKVESRDGRFLEVALEGHIVDIMRLLDDIYANPKYLNVSFLSISTKAARTSATLRINYGERAPVSP